MVDIYVLDQNFKVIGIIDTYESLIWTDRFSSYGDFEIYTAFNPMLLNLCQQENYISIKESDHVMIIEGLEIETNAEDGNKIRITGRSLESILDRRIIWTQTVIGGNNDTKSLPQAVEFLLNECIINPTKPTAQKDQRKISNFRFEPCTDEYINSLTVEKTQYTGDNLYEVITDLLEDQNNTVGFSILLDETTSPPTFVFKLYTGTDRSYDQKAYIETYDKTYQQGKTYYTYDEQTGTYVEFTGSSFAPNTTYYEYRGILPYVVFSPQFDNIINTDYLDSIDKMKNVTLVAGEGDGARRTNIIVGSGEGLTRRELYTDARDLKSSDYGGKYKEALQTRGYNKLVENSRTTSYEGQVEATRQYVFGINFFMGDIIQMSNEYGIDGNARVIEWVISESNDGYEVYPTFDAVQLIDDTTEDDDPE